MSPFGLRELGLGWEGTGAWCPTAVWVPSQLLHVSFHLGLSVSLLAIFMKKEDGMGRDGVGWDASRD